MIFIRCIKILVYCNDLRVWKLFIHCAFDKSYFWSLMGLCAIFFTPLILDNNSNCALYEQDGLAIFFLFRGNIVSA